MVFIPPEIVVFDIHYFNGKQRRFNVDIPNLTWHSLNGLNASWNDTIRSVIVISGTWQFFSEKDYDYNGRYSKPVPPGGYSSVEEPEINMREDTISSFKVISYDPQGDGFKWYP